MLARQLLRVITTTRSAACIQLGSTRSQSLVLRHTSIINSRNDNSRWLQNWHRAYSTSSNEKSEFDTSNSDVVKRATIEDLQDMQEISQETLSAEEANRLTEELVSAMTVTVDPNVQDTTTTTSSNDESLELDANDDPDWYLKETEQTSTQLDADMMNNPDWMPRWRRSINATTMEEEDGVASIHEDTSTTPWTVEDTRQWLENERADRVVAIDVRPIAEWMDWVVVAEAPTRSRLVALAEGLKRAIRQRQKRVHQYNQSIVDDKHIASTSANSNTSLTWQAMDRQDLFSNVHHLDSMPSIVGRDPPSDWLVVDTGDQSIHLFLPELRTEYDLDGMWQRRLTQPTTQD
ncbi:hypothetical protein BDF22DRAFT_675102 [Syncephalis plumigaleata]|nr:hypothetical protein BDF22DRAFT_675102 [Syncephalis plumigaleata]